jgi:hypothetical protein
MPDKRNEIPTTGIEVSDGGPVHWRLNDAPHVLQCIGGFVSLASERSMATHAGVDGRT